ncbi:MAG TPA: FecR domain-containing protein [Cyclobacteriaceae bacterium]|nr:FecR domain-containing protein [Cyclobacteriaceae bacterium]
MNDEKFWLLVARHFAGEGSAEDEAELQQMISERPEYKTRYDILGKYWGKSKQRGEAELLSAYQKLKGRLEHPAPRTSKDRMPVRGSRPLISRWVKISVTVALIAVASTVAWLQLDSPIDEWNRKTNAKGERAQIVLADGTTVWLNADSKLRYPDKFSDGRREVYLEGEAFFDVTKNAAAPFIIHLEEGDVKVVGTSFNVKAFKHDNKIETSVVTGKVAFVAKQKGVDNNRDSVLLTPNEKAVYYKESQKLVQLTTNSDEDKAWIDGTMIFRSTSFLEISQVLERQFGKKIVFDNDGLKACKLTGMFVNNTLDEVLELLSKTKDYTYKDIDGEWHIDGTGCATAP